MNAGKNGGFYQRSESVSLQRLTLFQALTVSLSLSFCQGICQSSHIFSFFSFFFFFQVSPRTRGGENEQGRMG